LKIVRFSRLFSVLAELLHIEELFLREAVPEQIGRSGYICAAQKTLSA